MFGDDCHCIVPIFPPKERFVEFVPAHTDAAPETVPATEAVETVIIPGLLKAVPQAPFVNVALYLVVTVIAE